VVNWKAYETADEAAKQCAAHICSVLETALRGGRTEAAVAVSGGSTPKLMFGHLARTDLNWSKIHLFWVDERGVPPTHQDSNYRMTEEYLIRPANIPPRNVHRIPAELAPDVAARQYATELREFFSVEPGDLPHFDLVHLGIGPDGHTASLFPGDRALEETARWVVGVPKANVAPFVPRVTLTLPTLASCREIMFEVAGADKRAILTRLFAAENLPANRARSTGETVWLVDRAAIPENFGGQ